MTDDEGVSEIPVDDETRAALLLFNQRLEESAAEERATKRVAKAERAKDEAATRVRNLGNDSSATAEQKAEAEAAYKDAVDEFQRIKENPQAKAPKKAKAAPAQDAAPAKEAASDDEPAPTEVSADEEGEPVAAPEAEAEAEAADAPAAPAESE